MAEDGIPRNQQLRASAHGIGRAVEIAYRVKIICALAGGKDVLYGKDMDNLFSPTKVLAQYLADMRDRLKPHAGLTENT